MIVPIEYYLMNEIDFFKVLKEKRSDKGFTQQQMADKLEISIKQYQNYEYKTLPPHDKLITINEILGFDLSETIYQKKVPNKIDMKALGKEDVKGLLRHLPFSPIPVHDIDLAASQQNLELYDDKSNEPTDYYYIPEFSGCRAFNVFSDSMEPLIPKGSRIFAHKIEAWREVLEPGQVYAVGLSDGRRFIKYVRKGPTNTHFTLRSENKHYEDFDVPKKMIRSIWLIDGWMNKHTQSTFFVLKLDKNGKMKK